jgi:hypothetical protein
MSTPTIKVSNGTRITPPMPTAPIRIPELNPQAM